MVVNIIPIVNHLNFLSPSDYLTDDEHETISLLNRQPPKSQKNQKFKKN